MGGTAYSQAAGDALDNAVNVFPRLNRLRYELRRNRQHRALLLTDVREELTAANAGCQLLREWAAREILKEAGEE